MYNRDGDPVHGRNEIVEVTTYYCRELYRRAGGDKNEDHWEPSRDNNEVSTILYSEFRKALNLLKKEKAVIPDKVDNESLKLFTEELIYTPAKFFNKILVEEEVPIQWNEAEIILIFKKGDKDKIKTYRPISLISNLGKTFMKIPKVRLYLQPDSQEPREQARFHKNYSTMDQVFKIKQILEKANKYNLKSSFLFIDFEKAFDTVDHNFL